MCNLKELTFACGHKQLRLLDSHCKATSSSTNTSTRRTRSSPEFCHKGVEIKSSEQTPGPCSPTCQRERALKMLIQKYREAIVKIEKISERALVVEKAAEKGAPAPHFTKHGERGWDPDMLARLCKQAFEETQRLLREYSQTKKHILKDLATVHLTAKSAIKHYTITTNGVHSELVFFDERPLVHFGDDARAQLHDLVCGIERRASEACLEKHGWKAPQEDIEQCEVLKERARWKQANISGTRMDRAYSGNSTKPRITTLPFW